MKVSKNNIKYFALLSVFIYLIPLLYYILILTIETIDESFFDNDDELKLFHNSSDAFIDMIFFCLSYLGSIFVLIIFTKMIWNDLNKDKYQKINFLLSSMICVFMINFRGLLDLIYIILNIPREIYFQLNGYTTYINQGTGFAHHYNLSNSFIILSYILVFYLLLRFQFTLKKWHLLLVFMVYIFPLLYCIITQYNFLELMFIWNFELNSWSEISPKVDSRTELVALLSPYQITFFSLFHFGILFQLIKNNLASKDSTVKTLENEQN